ncbi:hypothetical protein [Mesorhizobium neociceri]|uniref:Uncharacterized protein n=1 Tax=Mesorhizobium neociceri TaxID=1307853 RepID=A0A838B8T3_9HYPH|nr:hypothetical protein [Mesorhizobium neociceri]MBA1141780.1 hypothetical protein [Mesorhizobium neociceri]
MNLAGMHPAESESQPSEASDIVIRSYTSIGSMQGLGKIEVEAREAFVPERRHAAYFIRIAAETMGDYPQSSATAIQHDNIDKLLVAIDKLSNVSIKSDRFAFYEVEFEIDGLKIIVFNDGRGRTMFNIFPGNISVTFTALHRIAELRELIVKAKKHLDAHKIEY